MNKSHIRILHNNTYPNKYNTSNLFFWTVLKRIENQSTVNNLINTLQLKYKIV